MSLFDSLAIIGAITGVLGAATGVTSLVIHFLRDRARVKVDVIEASHANDAGLGLLQVQFKVDNVGNFPTTITSLKASVLDGTRKLTGKLDLLRDQKTQNAVTKGRATDTRPPLETSLSQHLNGHASEIYYATFIFLEGKIQSANDIPYVLMITHTHHTERKEGFSKPSMIQRVVGTQNPP
jgi:hypothetical protein